MEEKDLELEHLKRAHRQHPIPQHIGAFQFKLVGQMTIRQFAYVGGFGILAWVAIASRFHPLLKWPAAMIFTALGISFAFVPVAGRPLDKMMAAFFKAILAPTQRVWIKKGGLPEFFQPEFGKPEAKVPISKIAASRKLLEEYLARFKPKPIRADLAESSFISRLDFGVSLPAKVAQAAKEAAKEAVKVAERVKAKAEEVILPGVRAEERRLIQKAVVPLAAPVNFVERSVITIPSPVAKPAPTFIIPIGEVKVRKLHSKPDLSEFTFRIRGEKKFEISPQLRLRLGLPPEPVETKVEEAQETVGIQTLEDRQAKNGKGGTQVGKSESTTQTRVIPPPILAPPTEPNLIAGIVKDASGHLLEGVILIVKNEQGLPVRALKTNLLGQFSISTPLPAGKYTIETEKEGHQFSIIKLETTGTVLPPIGIVAKD